MDSYIFMVSLIITSIHAYSYRSQIKIIAFFGFLYFWYSFQISNQTTKCLPQLEFYIYTGRVWQTLVFLRKCMSWQPNGRRLMRTEIRIMRISEIDTSLNWFMLDEENIVIASASRENAMILLFSTSQCIEAMTRALTLSVDGTFKNCPVLCTQV